MTLLKTSFIQGPAALIRILDLSIVLSSKVISQIFLFRFASITFLF